MNVLHLSWPFLFIVYSLRWRQLETLFLLSALPFVKGFSFKCWVIIPVRNESKKHDSYRIYKQAVSHRMSNFLFVLLLVLFFCVFGGRWFREDHWWTSKSFPQNCSCYNPLWGAQWCILKSLDSTKVTSVLEDVAKDVDRFPETGSLFICYITVVTHIAHLLWCLHLFIVWLS